MIKIATAFLLFISITQFTFAQQNAVSISSLKNKFESFEYNKVISDADSMLALKNVFSREEQIEIFMMKGISQFSLSDDYGAQKSFKEILIIDPSYTLDSTKVSPKIISFFNGIKSNYQKELSIKTESIKTKTDTVYVPKIITNVEPVNNIKQAMFRSVLIPGLGHFYLGDNAKGWILTSLSAVTIASSIYFIIDSNKKEKDYLDETNPGLIQQKYDAYNSSYKMKNISILTFAVVWLYSQIDLLFLTPHHSGEKGASLLIPEVRFYSCKNLHVNFRISF
ncbi:MAG: hypothetical protein ACYCVH_04435 [Ignavibacteriaceae bacterium]